MGKETVIKLLILFSVFFAGVQGAKGEVPQTDTQIKLSFAPIVRKVHGAVVNIYARQQVVQRRRRHFREDPLFGQLFSRRLGLTKKRMESSLGSGVVLSAGGLVVTNYHVIKGVGARDITVVFPDKSEYQVKVKLQDKRTDLAVLQILSRKTDFPFLTMGDSSQLAVGDLVLAIGNPFGVGQSVSSGIISALGRNSFGDSDYQTFIQTDAAINPGNSGGALVDMKGQLIGINTSIYSRSGGSNGIGFAVPAQLVRTVLKSAKLGSKVRRPWLGAKLQPITKDMARSLGLKQRLGVLINHVSEASPAAKAGLLSGDLIVSLNNKNVMNIRDFKYRFGILGVGGTAQISILRRNKPHMIALRLIDAPLLPKPDKLVVTGDMPLNGAIIANLSPSLSETYSFQQTRGVVILNVHRNSYAASIGLMRGDVLVALNGVPLINTRQMVELASQRQPRWELDVKRKGRVIRLSLPG